MHGIGQFEENMKQGAPAINLDKRDKMDLREISSPRDRFNLIKRKSNTA